MRTLVILTALGAALGVNPALAETPAFQLVEDAALGIELQASHRVLSDTQNATIAACVKGEPSSGALFWLEISRAGAVTTVKVHGSSKPAIDRCLETALRKVTAADKLTAPIVVAGHIDLKDPAHDAFVASPRQSTTPVVVAAHDAKWQLTVTRLAYTSNRAADIAQALDGVSTAVAACAPKRGKAAAAEAIAWSDGRAIMRSGTPAYDDCIARAIGTIKLPAPDSALWMKLTITPPAEPLTPRDDRAGTRDQALRDALTTAVRSRKQDLLGCTDGHTGVSLKKVTLALAGTIATVKRASTGVAAVDSCVRSTFGKVAIPSAKPDDKLELEITLEKE